MACQFQENGPINVLRPWIFLEVVDEQGRQATPGEPGRLLIKNEHGKPRDPIPPLRDR